MTDDRQEAPGGAHEGVPGPRPATGQADITPPGADAAARAGTGAAGISAAAEPAADEPAAAEPDGADGRERGAAAAAGEPVAAIAAANAAGEAAAAGADRGAGAPRADRDAGGAGVTGRDAATAPAGPAAPPPGTPGTPAAPFTGPGEATPPLRKILEAILLVVDEPVPAVDLAQVVELPRADVERALADLAAAYRDEGRGFDLRAVAGGWRLYTAADCAPYVERFVLDGQQARLTQAALETLAVIAYRQPVSRQAVAAIRGVNVDGVVRTLLTRGLVAEAGQEGPGGAHLYVTTPYFLERLGLRSLDELPNLAPLLPVNIDEFADQA